ncbi:MAG: bifunctional metallophosphatase/5'-nucleotidase [Sphaerochaeta sp.]|nr:bifunctional metallophosphatase/5'-nucleotidase [Sphaerochaeta sp.]
MLVALLAFTLVGCKTAIKGEEIPPVPYKPPVDVPAEAPPEVEPVEVPELVLEPTPPEVPVPVPVVAPPIPEVFELVGEDLPYGGKQTVKNADGAKTFDLFIVHTNDLNGDIYGEAGGLGVAKLSTALKAGMAITDNWLLLNSGNIGDVPAEAAMTAAAVVDLLGYDAYTPQAIQLATGITGTERAAALSVNALDSEGYFVTQPYAVYDFNGFKVGVAGLTAPKQIQGVSFDSDLIFDNAQYAVDLANDYVDYLVILSDLGSDGPITSEMVAANVDGIDLIVDGNGNAMAKEINGALVVRADEKLKSVGAVQLSVVDGKLVGEYVMRLPAADVLDPSKSAIAAEFEPFANAMGYTLMVTVPEDPTIASLIAPVVVAEVPAPPVVAPPVVPVPEVVPVAVPVPVVTPPVVIPEILELVGEDLPYGGKQTVKNADGAKTFDLFIVHTNDLNGDIYGEAGGLGVAKLSTALKAGMAITDNWLLLNSGNIGDVPAEAAMTAAAVVDLLGYDAYTPQAIQLATGITGTKRAAALSVNALDSEGYFVTQPYAVYDFNGFKVGVAGLTAPKQIQGVSFDSDLIFDNAQYAVDLANDYVDYLVILSDLGSDGPITSEMVAANVDGIDLIVDGNGNAMAKEINGALVVRADEKLKSVGAVQLSVVDGKLVGEYVMRLPAADVLDPSKSAIAAEFEPFANAMGYTLMVTVPEDPTMVALVGTPVVPAPPAPAVVVAAAPEPAPAPVPAPVVAVAPVAVVPVREPLEYPLGVIEVIKSDAAFDEFDLFVVHTNDVHARIVPADGGMGYSKLATMLKAGRAITDNILLLDAGDVTHGTNLANMFEGETVGVLLDMLGYDAVAPGNHDFNYGTDRLLEAADIAEKYTDIRVLSANVLDSDGYLLFQPYQVYDFNGFKVAVVGLTTPDTATKTHPNNVKGVYFANDEIFEIGQVAIDMAREYVDYIIVLGHIGLDPDGESGLTSDQIVSRIKGIDLFVDGHSHTTLKEGMKIGDSLIVSTGEYLKNLGVVQIHVKGNKVTATYPMLIPAADVLAPEDSKLAKEWGISAVPNDPEVDEYVGYMTAQLEGRLGEIIAYVPEKLDGERANVRTKPTNLSRLITRAMTEESGADFTITNGGGIRASMDAGNVTIGDVINVLPFTNIITVAEITGADVYAALEHGYRMLPGENGGFSQTDLQVVYNRFAEPGKRILRVLLNGKLIDKNATYKVATNDFMAAGGDGYTMFGRVLTEGSLLSDVFIEFLKKNYPVR